MFTGARVVDALRLTTPDLGAVARSLVATLAMTAVALHWGSGASAMWAFGAATIAGAVALQDSAVGRVPVLLVVSLEMGAAVLVGALSSAHSALFVAVVTVWCFAAGMQWALGGNAGFVGAAATALLVIAPPDALSVSAVLTSAALAVTAVLIQAALIALWPPQRRRTQRDALTRAYRSLAADARSAASENAGAVGPTPMTWLREALLEGPAATRALTYQGGHRLPERVASTLGALRGHPVDSAVGQARAAAAIFLDAVAENSRTARYDAGMALLRLDTAVAAVSGPEAATAQRLSQQLHEVMTLCFGQLWHHDMAGSLTAGAAVVRSHLTWTSPIMRHAVRLAAAVAMATTVSRFAGVAHGYWIALTVLMVLRPETAHTYTRCAGRLATFAVGIAVASALTMAWQPTGTPAAMVAAAFVFLAYAVSGLGYLAVTAPMAAVIVFAIDISAAFGVATLENRLFAAVLGGALAVVAHVMLPDDGLIRLRQRAGELLMTEIDYAALVVTAFVHDLDRPAEALSAAWQRAFRARSAFEAASGAIRVDSGELRRWLRSYRTALNAVTSACTSLEESLPAASSTALSPEFAAAVDDYVDALRGAPPSPATPWTVDIAALTAANQKAREVALSLGSENRAARVLVAELATITRQLTQISAFDRVVAAQ